MANEETGKKPEVVLIKKANKGDGAADKNSASQSATPASSPKKKVVVRKKPTTAPAGQGGQQKKVVVAKKSAADAAPQEAKPQVQQPKAESQAVQSEPAKVDSPKPAETTAKPAETSAPKEFVLNSARPNVKAGNLSGGPRRNYGNGYGQRRNFTGQEAREGYQNRERDNRNNQDRQNNGAGGPGRWNQNRPYNRNPQNGGYNRYDSNGQNGQGGQGGLNGSGRGNYGQDRSGTGFNRNFNNKPGSRPGMGPRPGQGGPRPGFAGVGGKPTFGDASAVLGGNKAPAKKQFKGKKPVYQKKDREEAFDEEELYKNKKNNATPASAVPESIDIMESITVSDLAKKMNLKANEIIGKLLKSYGQMVTINQSIDHETAELLASEYNCKVNLISLYDETVIESEEGSEETKMVRPPIVTVMGHVDHGKTKTLDAIRNTNVVAGEAGGITQKIGAYKVSTPKGDITFLDTPGHEAFTMMRARGAQITDIVVLVVAADDGVMPQTQEAIDHAKQANVPIIVAVNKIDKPEANPERVMTQLSEKGLTPEIWGGETQYVNISALKREGIDELLDAILIQAEFLELKAQYDCRAEGKVIESRIDQGRGVVASLVIERGTLKVGDPFVAGIYSGRVRAMFNDRGQKIQEAGPSTPVEILGIESMPNAGDPFQVTESEKDARAFATKRQELKRFEAAKAIRKTTLESLYSDIANSEVKEFRVIIKADLQGSAEALKSSLEKLSTNEVRLAVIHSSAGAINESDVTLAAADSNAIIIGFNVRPTPKAKLLADQEKVEIRKYNIIYKCVEEIQQAMEGMLQPDTKEEVTGTLEVLNTFKVPKVGLIAGCIVRDGVIKRTSSVNVIRDGVVKFTGKVASLKRFKEDAKEVRSGFECGVGIENWQDLQVGDQIEAFEFIEIKRKLGQTLVDEKAEMEKAAAQREAQAKAKEAQELQMRQLEEAQAKAEGKARKAEAESQNQ